MIDGPRQRATTGLALGLAAGATCGAVDALFVAVTCRVPVDFAGAIGRSVLDVVLMAAVGAAFAALTAPVHGVLRDVARGTALAAQVALVTLGLAVALLAIPALDLYGERPIVAIALAITIPNLAGIAFAGTRLAMRRADPRPIAVLVAVLTALGGPVALAASAWREAAPSNGKSVLLITIDTLRRDHVGAYGGKVSTAALDALAADGIVFDDAISPMPETEPAHATMFTGLHPLRHRVLSNGRVLSPGFATVAETLSAAGYATGAFVSSFAVDSRTGLDRGFQVYDDDFAPGPGFSRITLVRHAARAWMRWGDPTRAPWLLERDGAVTAAAFDAWLGAHRDRSFFGWVHLFEPHAPYEPQGLPGYAANGTPAAPCVDHRHRMGPDEKWTDAERACLASLYDEEVTYSDMIVARLIDALKRAGVADRTMVVVAGDHGEMLGEHGIDYTHVGLYEEVVRVPLIVHTPGDRPAVSRVPVQVRLTDIAPTMLAWTGVRAHGETEGVSLLDYGSGRRSKPLGTALIGRRTRDLADGALIGARNNGVKYIRDLSSGAEELYLLDEDPHEHTDQTDWFSTNSPDDLARVRSLVDPDAVALKRLLEAPADDAQGPMLDALGYRQ